MRINHNQDGSIKSIALNLMLVLLLLISTGFGLWAFSSRSNYKNNSDEISQKAVEKAEANQKVLLEKEFSEKEKSPYKQYIGPDEFGSIKFSYPKTWNVYYGSKDEDELSLYFHPDFVPSISSQTPFALRIFIEDATLNQTLDSYSSQIKSGALNSSAYKLEKVTKADVGARLNGELAKEKTGSLVLLPLRDKTLKIWTENNDKFIKDFDELLKTLEYNP